MSDGDEFSWNTMIAAFANSRMLAEARKLFDETPNTSSIAWSSLLSGYYRYGCEMEAFELFREMHSEGQKLSQQYVGHVRKANI